MLHLNLRAWQRCRALSRKSDVLRIRQVSDTPCCGWDFGFATVGGVEAGIELARICLADLAHVRCVPCDQDRVWGTGLGIQVTTDHPQAACLDAQYAGWKIDGHNYFAMGSGPMRLAAAREAIFEGRRREVTAVAVGVLESSQFPPEQVVQTIAAQSGVEPARLCLLVARTASLAGTIQVVARSVETTMHKLMDLGFDLATVVSGSGIAPLPPVAKDDMQAIGWTNDAILYGAEVTLWVRGTDEQLETLAPRIPSTASHDYGEPFGKIFAKYEYDFYKIDPHLFSPARVRLVNLNSGHVFTAGRRNQQILGESFGQ